MFQWNKDEAIKCQIDIMEKEILYLKGKKRLQSRRVYLRLLLSCGKACGLEDPIYLVRST